MRSLRLSCLLTLALLACDGSDGSSQTGEVGPSSGTSGQGGAGGASSGGQGGKAGQGGASVCQPGDKKSCGCTGSGGHHWDGYSSCKPDGSGYGPCSVELFCEMEAGGMSGSSGQAGVAGAGGQAGSAVGGAGGAPSGGQAGQGGSGQGGATGGQGGAAAGQGGACVGNGKPPPIGLFCDDLTDVPGSWTIVADDGAASSVTVEASGVWGQALSGQAAYVKTESGAGVRARLTLASPVVASSGLVLHLALRASNANDSGWQLDSPVVTFEDAAGKRRTLTPTSQLLPTDGATWTRVKIPLDEGPGWQVSGDPIDLGAIRAIEVGTDTWGDGFWLALDSMAFGPNGGVCKIDCPGACHGYTCSYEQLRCVCPLGTTGEDCGGCAEGFVVKDGGCVLAQDSDDEEWPNAVSRANSDPWLTAHEGKIRRVKPRVLVVHFANHKDGVPTSDLPGSKALVESVMAGFREGSRAQGYKDASAPVQLDYQLAKLVDARDGAEGRPPAPAGWPFDNSTLYPRKKYADGLKLDYAAFFGDAFAQLYGFDDPDVPGKKLALCELIERGLVHELWVVASGDVASDASAYEVLESKQRYTAEGNKLVGSFERCAGNGCFEADVPVCGRSVRIGFVNYTRGPGCYLHSQGHGLESFSQRGVVPGEREWFVPFGAFDLDTRYQLPVNSFYGVDCAQPPCVSFPAQDAVQVSQGGAVTTVQPFDGVCGNVHFPPNGQQGYDYGNATVVLSSCEGFGRREDCPADRRREVSAATWAKYEPLAPDCGGAFLVWWYQNMPGYGSGQSFADGRPMTSVWPTLFY